VISKLTRREFLKIAGLFPMALSIPRGLPSVDNQDINNIIIIVFDSLSALHLPIHGYRRETLPNFYRFIDRSTVFHNHYATAPHTTPSTVSLLTGTHSWTHRAFGFVSSPIDRYYHENLFSLFDQYHRVAYTHNHLVDFFLGNIRGDLEAYKPRQELFLEDFFSKNLFKRDYDFFSTIRREILNDYDGITHSLFLKKFYQIYWNYFSNELRGKFPRGFMDTENKSKFILEHATDWIMSEIPKLPEPYLCYFHFWPPHSPYNTRVDFIDAFLGDGWKTKKKPYHILQSGTSNKLAISKRRLYDEFILYVDAEFQRLYDHLEKQEILEKTWIIFTSDHGEMFERGFLGHTTPSLHQPVVRIPLLISAPGQIKRADVYSQTSNIDILPTLLHISGKAKPDWIEGEVLPIFDGKRPNKERSLFALMASDNLSNEPINVNSAMIIKNGYKLTRYSGYEQLNTGEEVVEFYNLEDDPEERENLEDIKSNSGIRDDLYEELIETMRDADSQYKM